MNLIIIDRPGIIKARLYRRDKDPHWTVRWQTPQMAAPAFWYYHTKEEAESALAYFEAK